MISNAFKGAYTNEVAQQTQGIGSISQGVKDAATLLVGSLGFTGVLGEGPIAKGAEHALAGRVGGIGGNLMLATLQQKQATAKAASQVTEAIKEDQSQQVQTVFEAMINKRGMIETSLGEVDPKSEFGQKIKKEVEKNDNDG